VDPACGSGSFLIAAYQYLLDWFTDRYQGAGQRYKRNLTSVSGGPKRLTLAARKRILLNNIYGVDIDPQAVEVAKLSLLLKVIEGETQLAFAIDRLLPDLEQNVRCGNSLVGNDFFGSASLQTLSDDELASVNPFDWAEAFPDAHAADGFDAVGRQPSLAHGRLLRRGFNAVFQTALHFMQG
jgi:type I restriction-modification system DNA methylase subunit